MIPVSFHYNPQLVEKVKTIPDHKWHPEKKYWSFPNIDGTIEKILAAFGSEKIYIDSILQTKKAPFPLAVEGNRLPLTCFWGKVGFKDLGRELLSNVEKKICLRSPETRKF